MVTQVTHHAGAGSLGELISQRPESSEVTNVVLPVWRAPGVPLEDLIAETRRALERGSVVLPRVASRREAHFEP